MLIETATVADAPGIAAVHVAAWRAAYAGILQPDDLAALSLDDRTRRWQDILGGGGLSTTLVARLHGEVVGFVSYGPWRGDGACSPQAGEIWALYAAPAVWGQGAGRALMAQAVQALQAAGRVEIALWVLTRNQRGVAFYRSAGFSEVPGTRKVFDLGGTSVEEAAFRLDLVRA